MICTKGWTKSLRVKILMDLRDPFIDEITLNKESGQVATLPVKYERLPNICYYCGRVGHVEKYCEVKDEDGDGGNTHGFGEWLRASPWKIGKEGNRNAEVHSVTGRRLVFKPTHSQGRGENIPSIEQMADNLFKVCVEGEANGRKDKQERAEPDAEGGAVMLEQEALPQASGVKTTILDNPKKGTWHRLKRTTDQGAGGNGVETSSGGKHDVGEIECEDTGTTKRLKQGRDQRGEPILLTAEAAQQPCGMPLGS